jgi:excisionase family DNA binding protein
MAKFDFGKLKAFYSPIELADYLNISPSTLNRIISRREIVPHIIGCGRRISKEEVERYLSTRRSGLA